MRQQHTLPAPNGDAYLVRVVGFGGNGFPRQPVHCLDRFGVTAGIAGGLTRGGGAGDGASWTAQFDLA